MLKHLEQGHELVDTRKELEAAQRTHSQKCSLQFLYTARALGH